MKIADNASIDDNTHGGGEIPPCIRLTPDALPEVQQQTTTLKNLQSGVSTRNVPSGTDGLKTITEPWLPIISFVYPPPFLLPSHSRRSKTYQRAACPTGLPDSGAEDILFIQSDDTKFKTGQSVRIIDGGFKGVTGKVARYHGQQRVAIIIEGLLTACTAYIPSAFMEII